MQQAKIFLGGKNFLCAIGKPRSDDAFDEEFGDFFGGESVHDVIEREHAAERGDRVAGERLCVGIEQSGLLGGAARVVVLDDDRSRPFELGNQAAGGFEVDVVVVREFLALKLFRGCESRSRMAGGDVESRGLVGIFAVAQFLLAAKGKIDSLGETAFLLNLQLFALEQEPLEIHRDHAVVTRGEAENFSREVEPGGESSVALGFELLGDALVIRGVRDDRYAFEIFGGGAQHCGAADINIFDELFGREIFLRGGGFERIQIHDHQVDWRDAVFLRLLQVIGIMAPEEQAAVNLGMQCLHASAEHFRPVCEVGDVFYRYASFAEQFRGAAGRENFDFQRRQPAGKFNDAGFVEYAEQRALHSHVASSAVKDVPVYAEARIFGNADLWENFGGVYQDLTRALSFTWPSTVSTTYSTSWQFFCFWRSLVFLCTNSLKPARDILPSSSPACCLAGRRLRRAARLCRLPFPG